MAQLVVVEGPASGAIYPVDPATTIGSAADNAIVIDDRRVGAHEARFEQRDDGLHIVAVDGRELRVNSQPTTAALLVHGDIVTVGETMMLFNDEPISRVMAVPKEVGASRPARASGPPDSRREVGPRASQPRRGDTVRMRRQLFDAALDSSVDEALSEIDARDRAARRLATLFNVASAVHELTDIDALLERILDLVFDVFPAERGAVLLGDHPDTMRIRAHRSQRGRGGPPPHVSRTILQEVIDSGKGILTMDAQADDRFLSGMSIVEQNIRSAMCVPLSTRGHLIGAIHLDSSSRKRAFDGDDLELLVGIALQAAGAIENAQLYRQRRQHTEDLIRLSETTQQLSSYLDKATIYPEAVRVAAQLVGATRVSLLRLTTSRKRGPEVRMVESTNIDSGQWREIALGLDSLVGKVIADNEPLLVGGPHGTSLAQLDAHQPNHERYRSDAFVIVPIASKSDVFEHDTKAFAALCATEKEDLSPFDQRDLQLLEILANQVGIALTNAELYERATVDALTRVYVRRYFAQKLDELVALAHERGTPLALMMIDLDHFKRVNDTYGHTTGDIILRELGRRIQARIRERDIPARYGGEEFAVLMYDADLDQARAVADKLHRSIGKHPFNRRRKPLDVTASIGLATLVPGDTPAKLIRRADEALYRAKDAGRDRIVIAAK